MGSCVHGVRAAWFSGLVLRVGLIVGGDRSGCAWCQGWLCMGSRLGCGGRTGCAWGQGQYVRPCKHA